jgi:CRISPR-associated protein Cas2
MRLGGDMFILMIYDVNVDRVGKVLKIGRKYLAHVQNSVLEGELSSAQYAALKAEVQKVIHSEEDHVRFYILRTRQYLTTEDFGTPKRQTGDFL